MTRTVFNVIIVMLINRRHKIRLLTKLQFCPTSSFKDNPKLLPVGDGFGFLLLFHSFSYTFAAQKNKKTFDAVNSGRVF